MMFFFIISTLPFILLLCKYSLPLWAMAIERKSIEMTEDSMTTMSILDLPELTVDSILTKLSPPELCNMAGVCRDLRERCRGDYMWERHMKEKWSRVIGGTARRDWEGYLALRKEESAAAARGWACLWAISWIKKRIGGEGSKTRSPIINESIMSWYLALENGKFWFPGQVYNREHGHVGFVMSCYDAELSYNRHTDTFQARYLPHGRRTIVIEEGVQWDRIRAPPVDTSPHDLHASDCLLDLRPGDHIEIQWRKNKTFPYGWWYGVVGHLESCDGNEHFCRCSSSDTVVLEFNQYTPGSRWRRASISRKDHQEEGNETDGFYGGIRKLHDMDEISTWKRQWPTDVLE